MTNIIWVYQYVIDDILYFYTQEKKYLVIMYYQITFFKIFMKEEEKIHEYSQEENKK